MHKDEIELSIHLSEKKRQVFQGLTNFLYDLLPDIFESKKLSRLFSMLEDYRDYQALLREALTELKRHDALFVFACALSIWKDEGLVEVALEAFEDETTVELQRVVWNLSDQIVAPSAYIVITEMLNYQSQLTELIAIYLFKSKQCLTELVTIIESLDNDTINFLLSMMAQPQRQDLERLPRVRNGSSSLILQ